MKRSQIQTVVLLLTFLPALAVAAEPRGMVYDFGASWCGPCQQVAPLVSKLSREGLPIRKVDIDQEKQLADRFQIDRVPTFVLVIDGKEVTRKTGAMSESDLRQLISRIPQPDTAPAMAPGMDIEFGDPGTIPRPLEKPLQQSEIVLASNEKATGIKKLWPFKKHESPQTVRGNDTELGEAGNFSVEENSPKAFDPMRASVRIRVIIDGKINLGSGTVISSAPGVTQILTCGHIFRDFSDDAKIEVDLFQNGSKKLHIGRLNKFNLESDLGLITVNTDQVMSAAKVPDVNHHPQLAEQVAGIGCSGGENPTRKQLRVTAIDKYDGPSNIECTGLPVQGRSGGGLFNRNGEIIGVCIAADKKEQRGLYSGLVAIHHLLDECSLTSLYKEETSAGQIPDAIAQNEVESTHEQFNIEWSDSQVATTQPETPTNTDSHNQPVSLETGQAEVVVIIRDKSRPDAPNRVVIIHDASSKFFNYLDGELEPGTPVMPLSHLSRPLKKSPVAPSALAHQRPRSQPAKLPQTAYQKAQLTPTGLSQQVIPKRYNRSSH